MAKKYLLTTLSLLAITLGPSFATAEETEETVSYSEQIASVQGQKTSFNQSAPQPIQQTNYNTNETRTHTVVNGDTLWDLSDHYFSDPYKWPALWSFNPQVTNPHWIYPGDIIYLEPYAPHLVTEVAESVAPAPVPETRMANVVKVPGFYISELPETRGHVLFSPQEKHLLTYGDQVQVDWVDIEQRKKVHNGQRFSVFEESDPVMDENGDPLAYKLIRIGSIQLIDQRTDTLSTAEILEASRELERGNLIIADEDLSFSVQQKRNTNSLEGKIIDTIDLISLISSEQYVIINRGAEDGVAPGNRWVVFEQREGLDRLEQGEETQTQYTENDKKNNDEDDEDKDPRDGEIERNGEHSWVLGHPPYTPEFPKRESLDDIYGDREYTTNDLPLVKIGEILVIDSREKFCTGVILNSTRELGIDTRVVMIKGY